MSQRITREGLEVRLGIVRQAAESAGVPAAETATWRVEIGSKTYGLAYRLMKVVNEHGGISGALSSGGYLGMTAGEAAESLSRIADVFWFMAELKRQESGE